MEKIKSLLNKISSLLKNKFVKILLYIGTFLLFFVLTVVVYVLIMNSPVKMKKDKVAFQVKRGMHVKRLSVSLKNKRLIKSKFLFYALARMKKLQRKLVPGYYYIKKGMSTTDIVNVFANKKFIKIKIMIPEGLTNLEIAERLEKEKLFSKQEFLHVVSDTKFLRKIGINAPTAEGYLFPATYVFPYGVTPKQFIAKMVKNFRKITGSLESSNSRLSFHQKIILASLVEGETYIKEERPKIAAVYLNRLKIRKLLQACITVKYIKMSEIINLRKQIKTLKKKLKNEKNENEKRRLKRNIKILNKRATVITYRDLKRESRFNTYINPGLPPGPVCNPGLASIKAAFSPDKNNYKFFFWHKGNQHHIFSRTYRSHLNKLNRMRARLGIRN